MLTYALRGTMLSCPPTMMEVVFRFRNLILWWCCQEDWRWRSRRCPRMEPSNGKIHRIWSVSKEVWRNMVKSGPKFFRQDIEFTKPADALRNAHRTYLDPKKKCRDLEEEEDVVKNGTVKWKDSPHLNNLKRGVEKHGEKWTKIFHDKTLNLPNVSRDALRNVYTKYFKTKQRIVTPRKPLPPPLRPSRHVAACYQQKGLKDELIVTTNIAVTFAHAGKKTCLISANPKNPTVDMQKKRIAAREHNLKMRQLRQTNNTSSWVKKWNRCWGRGNNNNNNKWLENDVATRHHTRHEYTEVRSQENRKFRESVTANSGLHLCLNERFGRSFILAREKRVQVWRSGECVLQKWCISSSASDSSCGGYVVRDQCILHGSSGWWEGVALFYCLFDYLLWERWFRTCCCVDGYVFLNKNIECLSHSYVSTTGPDNSMLARLVCMSVPYIQVMCVRVDLILPHCFLLLHTFPEWYVWSYITFLKGITQFNTEHTGTNGERLNEMKLRMCSPRIHRWFYRFVLCDTGQKSWKERRGWIKHMREWFDRLKILYVRMRMPAIGRTYLIGHETLGYVILSTHVTRIDMNCANNGWPTLMSRNQVKWKQRELHQRTSWDRNLITYNVFTKQYIAWEEWWKIYTEWRVGNRADIKRSFELSYTERATLRVLRDNEKSVKELEDMKAQREKLKEMHILPDADRNGKVYAVCSEGGRGKTSTSIHTAGAFASLGKRVLLVDGWTA